MVTENQGKSQSDPDIKGSNNMRETTLKIPLLRRIKKHNDMVVSVFQNPMILYPKKEPVTLNAEINDVDSMKIYLIIGDKKNSYCG